MGKAKTSRKQKQFTLDMLPIKKLKQGAKTHAHDPGVNLRNPEFIAKALFQCMTEGDTDAFKEILRAHYEAVNTVAVLKRTGLSRRTFYSALSPEGNPSLSTVMKMVAGLATR
jgi:probable addiction module antidote protein